MIRIVLIGLALLGGLAMTAGRAQEGHEWVLNGNGANGHYQLWAFGDDGLPRYATPIVQAAGDVQQLVLDHWFKPLTVSPVALQAEFDAMLDGVAVPYLWLAGRPVEVADRDHLLAHVAQAKIETWSDQGHMAHLADPDGFATRLTQFATSAVNPEA